MHWWRKVIKYPETVNDNETDKMKKVLRPGSSIGDFFIVTNTKWRCHNVISLENSRIIRVPLDQIEKKIKVSPITQEMITVSVPPEIITFLEKMIPNFQKLNRYKEKLISCFRLKVYK